MIKTKLEIDRFNYYSWILVFTLIASVVIYLILFKTGYCTSTNIAVSSDLDSSSIMISWEGSQQGKLTNVIITVKDDDKILDKVHLSDGGHSYSFSEGKIDKKYRITFKDLANNEEYIYDRLLLSTESIPDIPTFNITTENYSDPESERIDPPEGNIGQTNDKNLFTSPLVGNY